MLKKRIIPCLDIKDGKVVKGVNFENLIHAGDPVEQAIIYNEAGADELCFLDINATADNRQTTYEMVEKVAEKCFIPFTVGGGVRTVEDVRNILLAGADKVAINSAAVRDPQLVKDAANKFGAQCIVVALDVKRNKQGAFEIYTHGGRKPTGIEAIGWARKMAELGAGELLVTSMDRDGTKKGFDNELNALMSENVRVPIIASGGVGKLQDFVDGVTEGKADALLAASVFHFGTCSVSEVKEYMNKNHIPVRIN
jgi:cyclase